MENHKVVKEKYILGGIEIVIMKIKTYANFINTPFNTTNRKFYFIHKFCFHSFIR